MFVKKDPWDKQCLCGKLFKTVSYTAIYCPDCRRERKRERDRKRYQQGDDRRKKAMDEYRAKNKEELYRKTREYKKKNKEQVKEYNHKYYEEHKDSEKHKLRQQVRRGDKKAEFELAKLTGKTIYCERMRVTALELPCGRRDECWYGTTPCPKTVELGFQRPRKDKMVMNLLY